MEMKTADRRSVMRTLAATPLVGAWLGMGLAQAAEVAVPGFREDLLPTQDQIWAWVEKVNSEFGPQRLTGSKNHVAFVEWLEAQFRSLGCSTQRDHYTFKRWEADMVKDVGASLHSGGVTSKLEVLSYFPYSGTTAQSGPVTGRLIYLPVTEINGAGAAAKALAASPPADLADCIVAIESPCPLQLPGLAPPTVYGTFPPDAALEGPYKNPLFQLATGFADIFAALGGKCKGMLFCWTDVSDDAARYQYVPFGQPLRQTPALWAGRDTAAKLKTAAQKGATVTLELRATITPNSPTDSLIAILPGSSDEIVTIGTHTDGTNINEENGAIGILAMAKYAASLPKTSRNRTIAFIMATGHMCSGPLSDKESCVGPGGQPGPGADGAGVYRDHPEIVAKTVAALGIEHLGAMQWLDDEAGRVYRPTHRPTTDIWFVGSSESGSKEPEAASQLMANATLAATDGLAHDALIMEVVKNGKRSPETSAPVARGIASMGLIPLPAYLLEASPTGSIEKLSPSLFYTQVKVLTKLMVTLDKLTADEIAGKIPIDAMLLDASKGRPARKSASLGPATLLGLGRG